MIIGKKEYKTCYEFNCPLNSGQCFCDLKDDEKIALYEKYETCCLFIKDGIMHFNFNENTLFKERLEFLESLKVMKKLQGDSVKNNNNNRHHRVTLREVEDWK